MGTWRVVKQQAVRGAPLAEVAFVDIVAGSRTALEGTASWCLSGITSNDRYLTAIEQRQLRERQSPPGLATALCAALIPIRKDAAWWALATEERRRIFEESSHHVRIGTRYLLAIARRLHHCRDLASNEPFDFLTWFEYASGDAAAFEDLVGELRATEEWQFVERECDVRLVSDPANGSILKP